MEGGRKVGWERGSSEKDKTDSPFSLQDVGIDSEHQWEGYQYHETQHN